MRTPVEGATLWLASQGLPVVEVEDGPDGRLNRHSVELRKGQDPDTQLLVLLHEMAHFVLEHAQTAQRRTYSLADEARREVTAETAAITAARLLGVDVSAIGAQYLASLLPVTPERTAGSTGRMIADNVKMFMR